MDTKNGFTITNRDHVLRAWYKWRTPLITRLRSYKWGSPHKYDFYKVQSSLCMSRFRLCDKLHMAGIVQKIGPVFVVIMISSHLAKLQSPPLST